MKTRNPGKRKVLVTSHLLAKFRLAAKPRGKLHLKRTMTFTPKPKRRRFPLFKRRVKGPRYRPRR